MLYRLEVVQGELLLHVKLLPQHVEAIRRGELMANLVLVLCRENVVIGRDDEM